MNDEKSNLSPPPEAIDELALQNVIRKRYCRNWPDTILQLTKRVQAVNQAWAKVVSLIMQIDGLSVTWSRDEEKDGLVVTITFKHPGGGVPVEEVELHEISAQELHDAHQYIEVLLMDKLDHSKLIARWLEDEDEANAEE